MSPKNLDLQLSFCLRSQIKERLVSVALKCFCSSLKVSKIAASHRYGQTVKWFKAVEEVKLKNKEKKQTF